MIFLKNILKKKILINILLLTLCFFTITEVKAETDYYDDEGNLFRLVFDDTPLRNFVKNDFAFVYDDLDNRGYTIALFEKPYKGYIQYSGYKIENDLLITIYETTQEYQNATNIKYVVNITPEMVTANSSSIMLPKNYIDNYVVKLSTGYYTIYSSEYRSKSSGSGLSSLNLEVSSYSSFENYNIGWTQEAYGGILLTVDIDGNVQRIYDLTNNYNELMVEVRDNARKNIFYSSHDIYDENKNLITPKEEFEARTITSNYSLTCDEDNTFIYDLHFDISGLKTNDKVVITYNDDSILLNETLTEQKSSFSIENVESGNYNIKVYDESGELIHENEFDIVVDSITIEDEDDTISLIGKVKDSLNNFRSSLDFLYQGWNTVYNELNREMKTGILVIISIIAISIIFKLLNK